VTKVLLLCPDRIGRKMAGVGIRYWEMARLLSAGHSVTLASPFPADDSLPGVSHVTYIDGDATLKGMVASHDVVVVQAFSSLAVAGGVLSAGNHALVVDLYCPFFLENALDSTRDPQIVAQQHRLDISVLREQLRIGDYFLCANTRQQDLITGMLVTAGRVTPAVLRVDPGLDQLIGTVPFGIPEDLPDADGPSVFDLVPGLTAADCVLVWGGGIYDWLDPITPVRAMQLVAEQRADVKLVFASNRGPHGGPLGRNGQLAMRLAAESRLLNNNVYFLDGWLPYGERAAYLRGATAGIVSHPLHAETRYSFRTRVLDYIWAGLPIVASDGDAFADLIRAEQLGEVVPPENPAALADGILRLVRTIEHSHQVYERVQSIRPRLLWQEALAPLLAYCDTPRHTRHLADSVLAGQRQRTYFPRSDARTLASRALASLHSRGVRATWRRVRSYVGRRAAALFP
jgi:hypothetical protein